MCSGVWGDTIENQKCNNYNVEGLKQYVLHMFQYILQLNRDKQAANNVYFEQFATKIERSLCYVFQQHVNDDNLK